MLRILLVSHYFWPESFRINQVAEDLIATGAEVTVLAGHPSYPEGATFPGYTAYRLSKELHPAGYEICRVPVIPRGKGAVRLALNYLSFTLSGILFGPWLLRRRKFDVVFVYCTTPVTQGFVGLWFGLLKRAPVAQWIQDLWPQALSATGFVRSPWLLALIRKIVAFMYRHSDLLLGQSHAFVRFLREDAGGTPIEYFPNPGEPPAAMTRNTEMRLPVDKFNVVFAGNLGKAQAMQTVVAAAELLSVDSDILITLFGSGSRRDWIAQEIVARNLSNLTLGGRVPPKAMPAIYAQASALLLCLIDDELLAQTVPSKLQSYLNTGVPIIAAVNGEAADIVIEAGAGIACPAEDHVALANALRRLRAMPREARNAMGAAGCRFFATHYKHDDLARDLFGRLQRVAERSRVRPSNAAARNSE